MYTCMYRGLGAARQGVTKAGMGPGAARQRAWGARTVRAPAATDAVGPGLGGGIDWEKTRTNTRQSPNILDIVSSRSPIWFI